MNGESPNKYLIATPSDLLWGITVTSTGHQTIGVGETYPPDKHPTRYLFSTEKGRTLDEFQFVYITTGRGWFKSASMPSGTTVAAGDLIVVFPGEWHSYCPDINVGWEERWIGCIGDIPQMWRERKIVIPEEPILHPGVHSRISGIYDKAVSLATELKPEHQKVLGALAAEILSMSLFFDKGNDFSDNGVSSLMEKAKGIIFSEYASIGPEEVSVSLGMGYSRFRKLFKLYFGVPPGQYILNIQIANAKELLTNSDRQIQEIAWETGFENPDYFTAAFRRITGFSPAEYRKMTRGLKR